MKNFQTFQISGARNIRISDVHQAIGATEDGEILEPGPVRVLFFGANPASTSRLRLDQEVKAIEQALRASRLADRFELEQSWAVGDRDLQDGLLRYRPDIVHLSGHGSEEGRVVLEPEPGVRDLGASGGPPGAEDPRIAALGRLFAATGGGIRCMVLNACHSLASAEAIAEHVGCVVGMSEAVSDSAATRFSWAFYNALGYGRSVKEAFELASAQIAMGGWSQSSGVPRLIAPKVDPGAVIFG
jgi:hypothetical protein